MRRVNSLRTVKDDVIIQSLSDDQLYRGHRRKSIYTDHIKIPVLDDFSDIRTSEGEPNPANKVRRKIIEFEGDGPLGIVFGDNNGQMNIKSIVKGSVSSEYFELSIGMNVIQINDITCRSIGYDKAMNCLGSIWRTNSRVTLHLEYNDLINDPKNNPVYKFLEGYDCSEYYEDFRELGARELEDLNFIEYNDLVKMKIPKLKIRLLLDSVKSNAIFKETYKSILTISFNSAMDKDEKDTELDRIIKLHSHNYIIKIEDDDV